MALSWENIAAILESPQGSTFFALLALLLLSAASLWLQTRHRGDSLPRYVITILAALMGVRLLEGLAFGFAWLDGAGAALVMPALERGVHLVSIVALAWLWVQPPEEDRQMQGWFAALLIALAGAILIMLAWLIQPQGATFNYTDLDYAWDAICLGALALAALTIDRVGRSTGLAAVGILFAGQLAHIFLAEPLGSMPLATEAAYLLSLPLLFGLVNRPTT